MLSALAKIAALPVLLLLACNPPPSGSSGSAPQAKKKADAGTVQKSCMAVVNGSETQGQPAIGLLMQRKGDQTFTCTGTFVSSNTMITAAHCFPFGNEISYVPGTSLDLTDSSSLEQASRDAVRSVKAIVSPIKIYEGGGIASTDSHKDLAVVIFPDGTAPATLPLLSRQVQHGEAVDIYGYGRTEIDGAHGTAIPGTKTKKRHGRNKVARRKDLKATYPDTLLLFGAASGEGTKGSLGSNGDSGGPMIIEGSVAGIASTAGLSEGINELTQEEAFTVYADLGSPFARNFFLEAEAEGAVFGVTNEAIAEKQTTASDSDAAASACAQN